MAHKMYISRDGAGFGYLKGCAPFLTVWVLEVIALDEPIEPTAYPIVAKWSYKNLVSLLLDHRGLDLDELPPRFLRRNAFKVAPGDSIQMTPQHRVPVNENRDRRQSTPRTSSNNPITINAPTTKFMEGISILMKITNEKDAKNKRIAKGLAHLTQRFENLEEWYQNCKQEIRDIKSKIFPNSNEEDNLDGRNEHKVMLRSKVSTYSSSSGSHPDPIMLFIRTLGAASIGSGSNELPSSSLQQARNAKYKQEVHHFMPVQHIQVVNIGGNRTSQSRSPLNNQSSHSKQSDDFIFIDSAIWVSSQAPIVLEVNMYISNSISLTSENDGN